jgi:hypothetical protein
MQPQAARSYRRAVRGGAPVGGMLGRLQQASRLRSEATRRSPHLMQQARQRTTASRTRKSAALRAYLMGGN